MAIHNCADPIEVYGVDPRSDASRNYKVMVPMGLIGLTDGFGNPSPRHIDYYIEGTRGGVSFIITGLSKFEKQIGSARGRFRLIVHSG
jgi:2,4-dienoyl-CoA reductase-like NADH-dependent reductase (Old Yellow Enzyme family)